MTAPKRAPSLLVPSSFIEHMENRDGELTISYFSEASKCDCGESTEPGWEINYQYVTDDDGRVDSAGGEGESLYTAFSAMLTDAELTPDGPT